MIHMKINFTCNNCRETFFVTDKNISQKSKVVCPNCDTEFPDEALSNSKIAIESLDKANKSVTGFNELGEDITTWKFSFTD